MCSALRTARELGAFTVAFTGAGGGKNAALADATVCRGVEGYGTDPGGAHSGRAHALRLD